MPKPTAFVAWLTLCTASVLVLAAYTRPDFIVNMANQIWLCF